MDLPLGTIRSLAVAMLISPLIGCTGQAGGPTISSDTGQMRDSSTAGDTSVDADARTGSDATDTAVDADTSGDDTDTSRADATDAERDAEPECVSELIRGEGEPLATLDECGRLTYGLYANQGQTNAVHILPDFSYAGYKQGGVALPTAPVVVTVNPGEGDDRQRIQDAIDQVGAQPAGADGIRGAVLLTKGTYQVDGTLTLSKSGVVLRGEGQGADGTVIVATRREQHNLIEIRGGDGLDEVSGTRTPITTDYVPVGSRTFAVESAAGFDVGDVIGVERIPNQKWIDDLKMGQWGWTPGSYDIVHERTITAIDGDEITIDIPIVDTIEDQFGGGEVFRADVSGRVEQVGVEDLRLVSEYDGDTDENHGWIAIKLSQAAHSWVSGVTAVHFGYAAVSMHSNSSFNTVQDAAMIEPVSQVTGGRRYSFNVSGGVGNLFQRCYSEFARHDFVSGSRNPGPHVWLDCYSHESSNDDGPHHRWATGLLFDNVRSYALHVENRQDSGSGHGWSGAQTMFWNSVAEGIRNFAPLGAMNWTVGSMGAQQDGGWTSAEPLGWWESHGSPVEPRSLYLQQLRDRLGPEAVERVTTPEQRSGRIWGLLANWRGDGSLADASASGGDPTCSNGLKSGSACCAASCGSCGGSGCGERPGGASACCTSHIKESGRTCGVDDAPCIVDPQFSTMP